MAFNVGSVTPRLFQSATKSFSIVNAATVSRQTVTVKGLTTDMITVVQVPSLDANLGIVGSRVSATDTLEVWIGNPTAGNITPTASLEVRVVAL